MAAVEECAPLPSPRIDPGDPVRAFGDLARGNAA